MGIMYGQGAVLTALLPYSVQLQEIQQKLDRLTVMQDQFGGSSNLGTENNPIVSIPQPARHMRMWNQSIGIAPTTTPLVNPNEGRLALLIVNLSTATIYLDQVVISAVNTQQGFPLLPGFSLIVDQYYGPWYGISSAPNSPVGMIELFR